MCGITFADSPVRIACLGDSITEGTVLKNRERTAYPVILAGLLGEGFEVRNFGKSGATVTALGDGALPYRDSPEFAAAKKWEPQIVVLLLGTNDTKTNVFRAGGETFHERYRELIESFRKLPSPPRIILCQPVPVMGVGRFTINEPNRQKLRSIVSSLAAEQALELIDFDKQLMGREEGFPDRVHPNAEVTAEMAAEVARQIQTPPSASLNQ